jgi:uncharacterized protein YcfJ
MKHFLIAALFAALGATFVAPTLVLAQVPTVHRTPNSHRVAGSVIESIPVYTASSPTQRRICEDVQVPIYGQGHQPQAGEVVTGMVIGGVLGKIVTGQDSGAVVGAVIGGATAAGAGQQRIVGYRTERQCRMETTHNDRIDYFQTRVRMLGKIYRVRTSREYYNGETFHMWVKN